jgi:hypothetical protein
MSFSITVTADDIVNEIVGQPEFLAEIINKIADDLDTEEVAAKVVEFSTTLADDFILLLAEKISAHRDSMERA